MEPSALRRQAESLRVRLAQLEQHDWPRWLREADAVSREISELLRRAAELERHQRSVGAARSYASLRTHEGGPAI
jgi:hypothetical protein